MKHYIKRSLYLVTLLTIVSAPQALANIVLNPTVSSTQSVTWGSGVGIMANQSFDIFAATESEMTQISITDRGVPGDAFALVLDSVQQLWSSSFFDGSGFFHGIMNNLLLTAGNHTIQFKITQSCCSVGGTDANFSAIVATEAAIPEPASIALLASGLLGFGASRRKKNQA